MLEALAPGAAVYWAKVSCYRDALSRRGTGGRAG
jgi:hypothetical protein